MGVWDKSTPAGTDPKSQGDDRLRELKAAIEEALQGQTSEGDEAVFPGTAPSTSPVFRYRGLKGSTGSRPTSGQYGLYFDTTRNVLQRDNGAAWEDVATIIPAGTVICFFQAAAPTGWTQVVTQNDKVLRVVSGAGGGSGGTIATSDGLAHTHVVNDHQHTITHRHVTPVGNQTGTTSYYAFNESWGEGTETRSHTVISNGTSAGSGSLPFMKTGNSDTANTGLNSPGTDSRLGVLAYADVILASKD